MHWGMGPAKVLFAPEEVGKKKKRVRGVISEKGGLTITLVVSKTEILPLQAILASMKGHKGKVVKRLNRLQWQYVHWDGQEPSWQDEKTTLRLMELINSHATQKMVSSDNFAAHHMASVCAVASRHEKKNSPADCKCHALSTTP